MFVISPKFNEILQSNCPAHPTLVVGVSGGADSLYLTLLLNDWIHQKGGELYAATVDHGLRPESIQEAQWVHQFMQRRHINHTILTWQGAKPKTRIEERARDKRYELLIDFANQHHADAICLAHHQQDNVETFWTRLARGSGLDGLIAIRPITTRHSMPILRPLLDTPKSHIVQQLKKHRIKWVEDPMNQDTIYERVRWRKNQSTLDEMGLTAPEISRTISRLQRAKDALDFYTHHFLHNTVHYDANGYVMIDKTLFQQLPLEIRIRLLNALLKQMAPFNKVISLESVENIMMKMPKHATLAGCQWVMSRDKIFITQELKHLSSILISANKMTEWGNCRLYSDKSFILSPQAPNPRVKGIPYLVQRTFPKIPQNCSVLTISGQASYLEKELEKKSLLDYKDCANVVIQFNMKKG